jgi:undecaprenyl-diphosphatase
MILDLRLFDFLFGLSVNYEWIGSTMVFFTQSSSIIFFILYIGGMLNLLLKKDKRMIPYTMGPVIAIMMVQMVRFIYIRERPFVALDLESLIYHSNSGSFPSQHAVSAFVIATVLWYCHKSLGKMVMVLAILTGVSRVMVGVHYPSDIFIGALIGIIIGQMGFRWNLENIANIGRNHNL